MATQNKSMTDMGNGSMETWKKVGAFLLGVGLLAAYHFAEDEKGSGGLKSTFDEIRKDLRRMGETVQGKVHEMMASKNESSDDEEEDTRDAGANGSESESNRSKRAGSSNQNNKNAKPDITVAQSH